MPAIGEDAEPIPAIGADALPIGADAEPFYRQEEIKPTPDDWHTALAALSRSTDELLAPGSKYQTEIISPEVGKAAAEHVMAPARLAAKVLGGSYEQVVQGMQDSLANNVSGFTLESLASLPAFAVPGTAETFAVNVASKLPEQYGRIKESIEKNGAFSTETARVATDAGITDLMGFLALHSTPKVREAFKQGITSEVEAKGKAIADRVAKRLEPEGGEQQSETQIQQEAGQPGGTQPSQPVPQDFIGTIPADQGAGTAEPAPTEGIGASAGQQPAPERVIGTTGEGPRSADEIAAASGEGAQGEGGQAGQEIAAPVETGAAPAAAPVSRYVPAIRFPNGEIQGALQNEATHGQIYDRLLEQDHPNLLGKHDPDVENGWVNDKGEFLTNEEVTRLKGYKPEGGVTLPANAPEQAAGVGVPTGEAAAPQQAAPLVSTSLSNTLNTFFADRIKKGTPIPDSAIAKLAKRQNIDEGAIRQWVDNGYQPSPEATAAEAQARMTRAQAPDGGFAAHPLVQFVMDSGLMSKSTARRVWGKARYEENKSLWDSAPEFPDPRQGKVYSKTGGQTPDKVASDAVEAGLLPQGADASTLFGTLQKIADASHRQAAIERSQSVAEKVASKQANSFARAVAKPAKGEAAINASDLQVGQSLKIRGENFKVTDIDPDTFAVTLEDGSKFGIQKVADNQVFYGEIKGGGKRAIPQGRQDISQPERPEIHGQAGESVLRDQGIQPPGAQEPVPPQEVKPVAPEVLKTLSPDALRAMLPTADPVTRGRIAWELGNRPPSELRPSAPPPTPLSDAAQKVWDAARQTPDEFTAVDASHLTPAERRSLADRGLSFTEDRNRRALATYPQRLRAEDLRAKVTGTPPTTPKLRPGEKGTGDLLQGEDQPFNLAGEKLDESAQKAAEEKAQAEQDRKIHDEENQVPFGFGPGGASIHENLNIEPQITQLNATVSKALRSPRNLNPRAAFTKAYQAVGKQFVTAKQSLQGGLNNVRTSWQVMKTILMRPPVVEDFINALKDWHFADTKTSIAVRDFVRNVRKNLKSPLLREAITNYVQADGDMNLLAQRAAASNIKYRPGYEAAMKLTPEQQAFAANVRQYFDAMLAAGQKAGLLEHGIENYVNQIWKRPNRITRQLQADVQSGKLQTNFQFARRRIFDSFFEGEQKGFVPGTKDIASLIAVYDQAFNKAISGRAFVAALRNAETAGGEKLVRFSGMQSEIPAIEGENSGAYLIRSRAVPEMAVTKDGRPYVAVDHPALRGWKFLVQDPATGKPVYYQSDMLVHPDYAPKVRLPGSPLSLKSILEPSALRQGPLGLVGKPLLTVGAFAKQTKLSLSIFHLDQEGLHGLFHRIDPANLVQIDLNDPVQAMLVRNGTVLLDYRAHELINEGVRGGGLTAKVPVLGRLQTGFNEFLFRDYIPRLKMTMAMHAFERNMGRRAFKGLTPDQVAEITANQANAAFGELNYRLLGRSQTMQDFLRLTLLAPDFLEARSRFVGQALKRYGGEQRAALILGGATTYVAARIMNQFLDNDPHWDKPFSVVHNKREYRLRTVMGDLGEVMTDPARFFNNRFSPWLKEGITVATQRDITTGLRLTRWEQLKHALAWLVPISIGGTEQANATQRFLGSAGISNKPARGAINDVYDMARAYKTEVAKQDPEIAAEVKRAGQETYAGSDYARLNMALYDNDRERIVKETEKLIEQKGSDRVEQYYDNLPDKPFTGSVELEDAFLRGLANDQGKLARYRQAVADRDGMARLFFQLRPYARPKRDSSLTR